MSSKQSINECVQYNAIVMISGMLKYHYMHIRIMSVSAPVYKMPGMQRRDTSMK